MYYHFQNELNALSFRGTILQKNTPFSHFPLLTAKYICREFEVCNINVEGPLDRYIKEKTG